MWRDCRPTKWPGGWAARKLRYGPISPTRGSSSADTWKEGSGEEMKHPSEATLALYAGGDLGLWERWRTRRHLNVCERCRREIEAYFDDRVQSVELAEL